MTGLAPSKAAQFFRSEDYISAQHTTLTSGIQGLVPSAGGWTGVVSLACRCPWVSGGASISSHSGIRGPVPNAGGLGPAALVGWLRLGWLPGCSVCKA